MEDKCVVYLETGSDNPYYNLAFEEYVLTNRKDADYLILWQNHNTIVIGVNQITQAEINAAWVSANRVNVVRRMTGGGAVYHDLGNLNYSFITDYHPSDQLSMERFTSPVVNALQKLGVAAQASGKNDIVADGRKISGTAQKITGGRILHHGTLLFDSDPVKIAAALNADPEKFKGKNMQSVRSRVGNIRTMLDRDMDISEFWDFLKTELSDHAFTAGELTAAELEAVRRLKAEKYDTPEWNYGRSPDAEYHAKKRYPGGTLETFVSLSGNHIGSISFYGDFMARKPLDEICSALEGAAFDADSVSKILDGFSLTDHFGSISKDEIIDLLFYNTIV